LDVAVIAAALARRGHFLGITCIVCLITLAVFFRHFLESGSNLIAGNVGDNRFCIAIMEHWRAVIHARASWLSPNFFWPEHGVLGYSESLFLFAVPYIIGRSVGLDHYIAFEITLILFKAIGFFSMVWLLRSFVGVSRTVALIGAILFTLSDLYFISAGHAHLMTVSFVPLLTALICGAWRAFGQDQRRLAFADSGLAGLLLALILFTSFYIGWFAIMAGSVCILVALLAKMLEVRAVSPLFDWIRALIDRHLIVAAAVLVFSVAIVPFVITYLPALKHTGGRSFEEVLSHSPEPLDALNIGQENWMWGGLLESIIGRKMPSEKQRGWPPIVLGFVLAGMVLGLIARNSSTHADTAKHKRRFLVGVLSASFVLSWLVSLNFHGNSLWWFVLKYVPGGAAIRVPGRYNFVLNVIVVVAACLVLEEFQSRRTRGWRAAFWIVSLLLIAEQINIAPSHLISRAAENSILSRVHRPPSTCGSFLVINPATPDRPFFANQIDAMLIARMLDLPTINGYSGWLPVSWEFLTFDANYVQNARQWALNKGVAAGLCGLDLRDGYWTTIVGARMPYVLGSVIDFRRGGNAGRFKEEGWGMAEDGGSWTVGGRSVLVLSVAGPPSSDLLLTLRAHAFTPPRRPRFEETLRVNNTSVADWLITDRESSIERRVRLAGALASSRQLRIEFINHDARSPAELGISTDDRKVGLALETLKLEPAVGQ
jgi:hypothetical protein